MSFFIKYIEEHNNKNALGNSKIGTPFLLSQKPRPILLFL
jgi:hypothetical protein